MDKVTLETFIKVAEESSFSRTAEQLHITQPAISKRIANLEEELDTTLFERIGKTARLTSGGEILLPKARKIIEAMRDCKTEIQNLNQRVEGPLKIGVSHHIGLHRFPPYLKEYSQLYPNVQLNIAFIDSEKAYPMILKGELEIALITLGHQPNEDIHQTTIWKDALTFVASDNHELAKLNESRPLTIEDLSQYPAILPGRNTHTGQLIQSAFNNYHQPVDYYIETNYLETIKMMVSIGLGWGVLPRTMLNKEMRGLQMNIKNLSRSLGYITHKKATQSNTVKALINTLSTLDNHDFMSSD